MIDSKKAVIYVVGGFILICVLFFVFYTLPRIGKIPVNVLVNPSDSDVYIDGDKNNNKTVYLRPGEHSFTAKKPGWADNTVKISVSEENSNVGLLPTPNSQEAEDELGDQNNIRVREGIAGTAANARGLELRGVNPIINKLPYSEVAGPFKIDYGFNESDNKTAYILVTVSTPDGRVNALKWLDKNGVDITRTEIVFSDFTNPLYSQDGDHSHGDE